MHWSLSSSQKAFYHLRRMPSAGASTPIGDGPYPVVLLSCLSRCLIDHAWADVLRGPCQGHAQIHTDTCKLSRSLQTISQRWVRDLRDAKLLFQKNICIFVSFTWVYITQNQVVNNKLSPPKLLIDDYYHLAFNYTLVK